MSKPAGLKRSQAQEKRLAKSLGGSVNSGSGNGLWRKGDVRVGRWLIEAKCRARPDAKQITIKQVDLEGNAMHAATEGRSGLLSFELGGRDYLIVEKADASPLFDE